MFHFVNNILLVLIIFCFGCRNIQTPPSTSAVALLDSLNIDTTVIYNTITQNNISEDSVVGAKKAIQVVSNIPMPNKKPYGKEDSENITISKEPESQKLINDSEEVPPTIIELPEKKTISDTKQEVASEPQISKTPIIHDLFDRLLQKYVTTSGKVDYKNFKKESSLLDTYINNLAATEDVKNLSKNEALAFWMNLYNALTIQLILKEYPIHSINDIAKGKPWDIQLVNVAGVSYSLNDMENKVLRPIYKEPLIHFGLNCAAISCPPLLNHAFDPKTVMTVLKSRAESFINGNENILGPNNIVLSPIFDWYKEDFGHLLKFINKYSRVPINDGTAIKFNKYNWNLNE